MTIMIISIIVCFGCLCSTVSMYFDLGREERRARNDAYREQKYNDVQRYVEVMYNEK